MKTMNEWIKENEKSLRRYCRARWNGSGDDVMHETVLMLLKSKKKEVNFTYFTMKAREVAERKVKVRMWQHDDERTIICPPTTRSAERLDAARASAKDSEDKRMTEILAWLEDHGLTAEEVLGDTKALERARAEISNGQLSFFNEYI